MVLFKRRKKMDRISKVALLAGVCLLLAVTAVQAASSVTWTVTDLTTTGGNVYWTSPTAIDPGHVDYNYTFNITQVEAKVFLLGWLDVTGQLPSESLTGSGTASGPCPIELFNDSFSEPGVIDATVHAYADVNGFGHMDMTNISLGSYSGVNIEGLRLSGTLQVEGVGYPELPAPDVHYTLQETAPGTWEVRAKILNNGVNGNAVSAGLSAYEVWVDGVDNSQVSFTQNTLSTSTAGFQTANLIAGEATDGNYNLGNYQNEGTAAILGVGLTDVLVGSVDLDADALLGILTTPTGLDEANFRAGAAGLLNAAGDGFLNTDDLVATLEVIPFELLMGDANRDGVVSAGDYASVQANFGHVGDPGILGDANCDGVVSAGDYASVQANFGAVLGGTVQAPEPAMLSMLALGGLAVIRRKRK